MAASFTVTLVPSCNVNTCCGVTFIRRDVHKWFVGAYVIGLLACPLSIVLSAAHRRSQEYLVTSGAPSPNPVQFSAYFTVSSALFTGITIIVGLVFGIFAKFSLGRKILLAFPRLFTLGR